ncbi:YqaE/Pmp3 family membrane protein [Bacteroidota bacterium]
MAKKQNDILLLILAILLPPIAVFLKKGVGKDLLINIILCIIFWLPGIIHALWLILK